MNCNVFIQRYCSLQIKGEPRPYQASKGEVFSGTAKDNGRVIFHVRSYNGKICPVWLDENDERIKVEMFKN